MTHTRNLRRFAIASAAIGANVLGALAIGAFALGALAIGRLVIGRLRAGKADLKSVSIENLTIDRYKFVSLSLRIRLVCRLLIKTNRQNRRDRLMMSSGKSPEQGGFPGMDVQLPTDADLFLLFDRGSPHFLISRVMSRVEPIYDGHSAR